MIGNSSDINAALARVQAAKMAERNAVHEVNNATTWGEINNKKTALAAAEAELEDAQNALSALQKASNAMNSFAMTGGLAQAGSSFLDNAFSTGTDYGSSLNTALSAQRTAQVGFLGLNSLADLSSALDDADNSISSTSSPSGGGSSYTSTSSSYSSSDSSTPGGYVPYGGNSSYGSSSSTPGGYVPYGGNSSYGSSSSTPSGYVPYGGNSSDASSSSSYPSSNSSTPGGYVPYGGNSSYSSSSTSSNSHVSSASSQKASTPTSQDTNRTNASKKMKNRKIQHKPSPYLGGKKYSSHTYY